MRKIFKQTLSMIMVVVMLICAAPLDGFVGLEFDFDNPFNFEAKAATDPYYSKYGVTYNQLFNLYPYYLSPEAETLIISNMKKGYNEVLDSYSDVPFVESYMYALKEGVGIFVKELAGLLPFVDSTKEELINKTSVNLLKEISGSSGIISSVVKMVSDSFSDFQTSYDLATSIGKNELLEDLREACKNLSDSEIKDIFDEMLDNADSYMEGLDYGIEYYQFIISVYELQEINEELISILIEHLPTTGDFGSELIEIRNDMHKNIVAHVVKHFLTNAGIKLISKAIKGVLNKMVASSLEMTKFASQLTTAVASLATSVFAEYIYDKILGGVMADELVETTLYSAYVYELGSAVTRTETNFMRNLGKVTDSDIAEYEAIYSAYLTSIKTTLVSALEIAKNDLQRDYVKQSIALCDAYSYEKYINLCMQALKKDIDAGKVAKPPVVESSGSSSTVTPEESRVSIQEKFKQLQAAYPPNQNVTFTKSYGGAIQCFGFARFAFNKLFDCDMPSWYHNNKRYEYGDNQNVVMIGQLSGSAQMTEANVKELLFQSRLGDIIQACGSYSQHTMMVVDADETGVTVYECNWHGECGIYQRKISYASFAQSYGTPHSVGGCGVSLYRAANYDSLYWDGSAVFYDDSVNFVIDDNGVLTKYNGWQQYVVIPEEVTAIGNKAFYNNDRIIQVVMTDNVKSIGNEAFYGCDNLYSCEFSNKLETIGDYVFRSCNNLSSALMPNTVLSVGQGAYYECANLSVLTLSEALTSINYGTFYKATRLKEAIIPDGVTQIHESAFSGCSNLEIVNLPKELVRLYEYAFADCVSIQKINVPKSLTTGSYNANSASSSYTGAFKGCSNLKTVDFEEGCTEIPYGLFANCDGLESIEIPDTVTTIEKGAFYNAKNLKEVDIGNSVTSINTSAFSGCVSLSEIIVPNSVTVIENWAFDDCVSLKDITLSKSLKSIGASAFRKTAIESIEIPKSLALCGMTQSVDYKFDITNYYLWCGPFVLCENLKTVTFESGITQIVDNLFAGCVGLEEIEIPDTVTEIGESAFSYCLRLSSVTLTNIVKTIGKSAFYYCVSLPEIIIPDSVIEISGSAFYNCKSLVEIEIPDSVTNIGQNCFSGCSSLELAKLSDKTTDIIYRQFENCTALKTIDIPATVETIRSYAFYGCTSLESVNFAENSVLKTIDSSAFLGCTALKKVILPETTKTIYGQAFKNCTALTKVYIPESTKTLDTEAFMGCENLSDVNISDYSITEIKSNTFKDCPGLKEIVLPKGLTKIGSQAFMNATGLEKAVIPESVTSIDNSAFSYPDKMTIYGKTGSYAETFAKEKGFEFVDDTIPTEGMMLKDGIENITLELGETYRAEFEVYPEDANEVISLKASNNIVTISGHDIYARYTGDCVITASTLSGMTYDINVHIKSVSRIEILNNPNKMSYVLGEDFDTTGMKVQVVYGDGSVKEVTDYTITGFDSSVEGTSTLTITWKAINGSTYTKKLTVNIVDTRPKLTEIFVDTPPTKTEYELRERLDLTGLVIKGNYTDGSSQTITDYNVSGYNALKKGEQTITVTSGEFTTTFVVTVTEQHSHSYTSAVTTPATCTTNGVKTFTCSCGDTYTESIVATGHAEETLPAKPATCSETGLTEGEKCSVCGETLVAQQEIAKENHSYDNDNDTTCNVCGDVREIETHNHSYTSNITTPATCTKSGVRTYICSCSDSYTESIKATGHKETTLNAVAATCISTGKTAGKKCSVCGTITVAQRTVAKTAHNSNITIPAVVATYSSEGKTAGKKCSACGKITIAQQTIAKLTLSKVSGLKAKDIKIAKSSEIKLVWNKVSGAEEYEVYQYVSKKWKKIKTTSSTSYTVKKLKADKEYKFKVRAVVDGANGAYSSVLTVKTVPATTSKLTLKAGKKQLTVSWSTVSDISGYEVQYSTSKKFTKKTTKTVSAKKSSKKTTIKKLTKGKKYYVRVRTYKTVNGKKIYSDWSTVKNERVK